MEVGIQRTDTQRSQQNGPRVSFNRDVHVKRIGKRSNESTNYPIQTKNLQPPETSHLRREPPTNLDEKSILKEATLVLKQAERVKCKAESNEKNKINVGSLKNKQQLKPIITGHKFNSLPTRRKNKSVKPVSRSVSDASAKKTKKPSIFNLFSRRSDTNLNHIEEDARFKESGGRRLIRSKSDVVDSTYNKENQKTLLTKRWDNNENNISNDNLNSVQLKSTGPQLSPIIENAQKESYFEENRASDENIKNITLESNTKTDISEENSKLKRNSQNRLSNKENSPPDATFSWNVKINNSQSPTNLIISKDTQNSKELKLGSVPVPVNSLTTYQDMHSSQLPPEKLPLTKGLTVDGMVKRLSMERFSPPPTISGPAFSYTRPNEPIIYAQLAPDQIEDTNEKILMRTPTREMESPSYKTFQISNSYKGTTTDRTPNYFTSHNNNSSNKKSEVYLNGLYQHDYEPKSFHSTIYRDQNSPTQWKRLSPRNLSDDEGLGFEPRKYFEDELPNHRYFPENHFNNSHHLEQSKSPSVEPLIVPVIHGSSPPIISTTSRRHGDSLDARRREYGIETRHEFNNLSNRREALESKIYSRKFVSNKWKPVTYERDYSPNRNFVLSSDEIDYPVAEKRLERHERVDRNRINKRATNQTRYLSPERENVDKFHKLQSHDVVDRYAPDHTHLDKKLISREPALKSSIYVHTRYFDDDKGRYKEVHEKETSYDEEGKPHVKEFVRKERLDLPETFKDPLSPVDRYRIDCEPKGVDPHTAEVKSISPQLNKKVANRSAPHDEKWHIETLTRDKRQQRSFDKGDSGIENDFRKESFNGDLTTKWQKPTTYDVMKTCELFIKKERRHTEDVHHNRKKYDFVFRERSIDDGSHFDPRLDKYPKNSTLRRKETFSSDKKSKLSTSGDLLHETIKDSNDSKNETLKRDKKIGGFERVKKLFGGKKKGKKEFSPDSEKSNSAEKENYMVNEDEMRSRYMEYRGPEGKETINNQNHDISTRRRLSTPRASPSLKRTPSDEEIRSSLLSQKSEKNVKPEKTNWFKSLDRKSKKKNEKNHLASSSFRSPTEENSSTLNKANKKSLTQELSGKSYRFFGDTDMESNPPTISKAATTSRVRNNILNQSQKYSQSAYNLDRIPNKSQTIVNQTKSNSLQNLDDGNSEDNIKKTRHHSRSRNKLKDISESGSETEGREVHHTNVPKVPSRDKKPVRYRYNSNISPPRSSNDRDSKSPLREVSSDPTRIEFRKPPPGPPKPSRSMERSRQSSSYSKERDRLHDSSGTEGDSSLHSQRSVVFLHATTVGDIPQPYRMSPSKRRTISRDDLHSKRSVSTHNSYNSSVEPMAKSVSRSVSMLAPWTPKRRSDGYEINYAADTPIAPINAKQMPAVSRKYSGSVSSLGRSKSNHYKPRKYASSKEDLSSARNTSRTSTSKSGMSNRGSRIYDNRETENKNEIGRRSIK